MEIDGADGIHYWGRLHGTTGDQERVEFTVESFFGVCKQVLQRYGHTGPNTEVVQRIIAIPYGPGIIPEVVISSDDKLTVLLCSDKVAASVYERRTDGNNIEWMFSEFLGDFEPDSR